MTEVKQGTRFHLGVKFNDLDLEEVEKIEFIFCQNKKHCREQAIKTELWQNGDYHIDNAIPIGFTIEETYMFKQNAPFYMDTRVYMNGTEDMPKTEIVELIMSPTLFEE